MTSLLENSEINKTSNKIKNPNELKNIDNKEIVIKKDYAYKIKNQNESENIDNKKIINKEAFPVDSLDNKQTDDLKEKWELILSKLELPSTRMLLSQQAELNSINSNEVTIALSPNWENMIKSRKVIIEDAVKKVFGKQIKLNFSSNKLNKINLTKLQGEVNKNLNENKNTNIQNSDTISRNSQKQTYDNNSKNLADFFNGEIVDFND